MLITNVMYLVQKVKLNFFFKWTSIKMVKYGEEKLYFYVVTATLSHTGIFQIFLQHHHVYFLFQAATLSPPFTNHWTTKLQLELEEAKH